MPTSQVCRRANPAHANKLNARFDNVTRIQNELRVDTFLPPDDPRNKLKDITEKFDHVFWCGDLNCTSLF